MWDPRADWSMRLGHSGLAALTGAVTPSRSCPESVRQQMRGTGTGCTQKSNMPLPVSA